MRIRTGRFLKMFKKSWPISSDLPQCWLLFLRQHSSTRSGMEWLSCTGSSLIFRFRPSPCPTHYGGRLATMPSAEIPMDGVNGLVKNISTGYAQVFSLAKSWISHCKADLPHVVGTTTRPYPASFEDYYWNIESVPLVTNSEMNAIGKIFSLLSDSEENQLICRLNG